MTHVNTYAELSTNNYSTVNIVNPYIEEEQTAQWPKEKVQKDKQRFTQHTYKTRDQVTRTPLKTGGELSCSERVSSSCSTSDTRRVDGFSSFSLIVICFIFLQLCEKHISEKNS
jgi:hypothetical protein